MRGKELQTRSTTAPQEFQLSHSERKKRLEKAIESPNWAVKITNVFPDVVNQEEIRQQTEILSDLVKANENYKKWSRRQGRVIVIGLALTAAGMISERAELLLPGFALTVGSVVFFVRGDERRIRQKFSDWSELKTGWWMRETG